MQVRASHTKTLKKVKKETKENNEKKWHEKNSRDKRKC